MLAQGGQFNFYPIQFGLVYFRKLVPMKIAELLILSVYLVASVYVRLGEFYTTLKYCQGFFQNSSEICPKLIHFNRPDLNLYNAYNNFDQFLKFVILNTRQAQHMFR